MGDALVFRTNRLIDSDMVAAALQQNGVPFYRRQDGGGVEVAMPAAPAPFPGVFFSIYVPAAALDDARAIIEELPVREPEHGPPITNRERRTFHIVATIAGVAVAALVVTRLCPLVH